jgi:beta-N-acetylhexosaminidase
MTPQGWSLPQKIGQLFMVGFEGTAVTPPLRAWLERFGWGGVIVFGRNVESPAQLAALTRGLQEVAQSSSGLPLLVAVDQEGGRVARLKAPFTAFPSAAAVGQVDSEELAFEVGCALGRELSAVGINMNMAPVLDVLTNPANAVIGDRAFSSDARRVACLAKALMRGLHAAGVLAVGKHFPGHGGTLLDSHLTQAVCERTGDQLQDSELLPFREAIAAGIAAIMTAHVVYPAWDAQRPATLSPPILTGVLRERLGFQGVIITDDLGMAAVSEALPWEDVPVQALRAGAELLLICHQRQRQEHAYVRVLAAVRDGELPEHLVDRAVSRIRELKARLRHLYEGETTPAPLDCIGSAVHQTLAETLREGARQSTRIEHSHGE